MSTAIISPQLMISIHSPRAGRDAGCHQQLQAFRDFNPLSPCGERRRTSRTTALHSLFQSTLPVRGETMCKLDLEELYRISIHSPRAGRDTRTMLGRSKDCQFQSTLPVRGETSAGLFFSSVLPNFNPLSPCGERLTKATKRSIPAYFNPLSPCGERLRPLFEFTPLEVFQSTLPVRGETDADEGISRVRPISIHSPRAGRDQQRKRRCLKMTWISIHSPRAGRDLRQAKPLAGPPDFNPLSPCGERPGANQVYKQLTKFQSTLPVRGETITPLKRRSMTQFQSTLPVRGETWKLQNYLKLELDFNPLSPCGERPLKILN